MKFFESIIMMKIIEGIIKKNFWYFFFNVNSVGILIFFLNLNVNYFKFIDGEIFL